MKKHQQMFRGCLQLDEAVVGAIYGKSTVNQSTAVIIDSRIGLFDFVITNEGGLSQINDMKIESNITPEIAKRIAYGEALATKENVIASLEILENRTFPLTPGSQLMVASSEAIKQFLGLDGNIRIGTLMRREEVEINLDQSWLSQHMAIMGKTGSGKSNASKLILSQLKGRLVIFDPHSEYKAGDVVYLKDYGDGDCDGMSREDLEEVIDSIRNIIPAKQHKVFDSLIMVMRYKKTWTANGLLKWSEDKHVYGSTELRINIEKVLRPKRMASKIKTRIDNLQDDSKPLILRTDGLDDETVDRVITEIAKFILILGKEQKKSTLLMIDEAHRYVPQVGTPASKKAINALAAEGRKFGCGLILMSQRPAKVDKNTLSQCGTAIIFRVTNQNDVKQLRESTEFSTKEMYQEVQKLETGNALLISDKLKRPIFVKVDEFK